jgi:macrolide-specific efflux system membrane fusion protein
MWYFFSLLLLLSCENQKIHPRKGEIVEAVYGLGTVKSEEEFQAKTAIITSVEEFYVSEGQDVVQGQKLFKTDQGSVTTAPFDGRVTDIHVSIRENLFPQSVVLTVINLKKLFLSVSLEQQGAMRVRKGISAEISFEFFRNKKIKAVISTIYPSTDQFIAKVVLNEWPPGVLPGMTADVAFEIDRKKMATLVPARAIVNGHLHLKREGKKMKFPVQLGLVDLEMAEVLSPELKSNDEIIIP